MVTVDFTCGLEAYFPKKLIVDRQIESLRELLNFLKTHPEASDINRIYSEGTLVPGIIAIVNGVDSDVYGSLDIPLENGDSVCFLSIHHGG